MQMRYVKRNLVGNAANRIQASVTLEGIDNAQTFVEKLDLIEPPGQLISFLHDPLLQKYVELKPSPIISRRIEHWLAACLEEQYDAAKMGTVDDQLLDEMLGGLLKHAHYTKVRTPLMSRNIELLIIPEPLA